MPARSVAIDHRVRPYLTATRRASNRDAVLQKVYELCTVPDERKPTKQAELDSLFARLIEEGEANEGSQPAR